MSTYSAKFENLIAKFPEGEQPFRRLAAFWDRSPNPGAQTREFPINRLMDIAGPVPMPLLITVLSVLVQEHVLDKVLRVESPVTGGGIEDFQSVMEIPAVIHDWRTDTQIAVTPDQIKLIFRLH